MTSTSLRTIKNSEYRWYDYLERAWFTTALIAVLVFDAAALPALLLALIVTIGLVIALVRIVAAIADLTKAVGR